MIFGCPTCSLLPKLAMGVGSVAKVGEDFASIALFLIGYPIIGEQYVKWVKPSSTLEEIKGFLRMVQLEKGRNT